MSIKRRMSIKESSATALVRCTGLAMICLNKTEQRVEFGLIHDNKHVFTLKVKMARYVDGSRDDLRYDDILEYKDLPDENVRIEIKAQGAGYQVYENEDFERRTSTDLNDFGWLVSLQKLHGQSPLAPTSHQPHPLTKVHVHDGLFYTHQLDEDLEFAKVRKDADGIRGKFEMFGKVAKTLGALIEGDKVSLTIRIGEKEERHELPRIDGIPYIIELSNNDPETRVMSDMPDYYQYVTSPNGDQYELRPVNRNGEDFCHPVVLPLESIDEL